MRFGADYYPEHWPRERWEEDARLMKEAGFNIVRLAEFAWSKMEPWEGHFDFEWLLEALRILQAHGIQAVIGTPTAAAPAWLCTNKPEVLRIDENRRQVTFGNRQQCCYNQPAFREASDRIVEAMAKALGGHEAVYGWQTDNEFGPLCYCDECQRQFQKWVEHKYGTLHALEAAWGTEFWSHTYTDWKQIPLPWNTSRIPNPSLALDYRRFYSDCFADFQHRQIEIIRRYSDRPVTHNFMGLNPEVLNYKQLADQLDFISWDNYPFHGNPVLVSASHDLTRGYLKKNFWVMEEMSGPGGWGEMAPSPKPGRIREWTYHAIGRGADGMVYFRWRPCRSGTEQYWHGILNHDGSTNRRYDEIKQTRAELKAVEDYLEGTTVRAQVAFINDYDSRFAFQYQKSNWEFSYLNLFLHLYTPFYRSNVPVDVISGGDDLSSYKIVVAPGLFVLDEKRARQFSDYVENGGVLVMTFRSAVKNETGLIFNEPLPGLLQKVFGATVKEYHSPVPNEENTVKGTAGDVAGLSTEAKVWLDLMEPDTAEVLARYETGFIPNEIAVTRNSFGRGTAYYLGTQTGREFTDALMRMIISEAGVERGVQTPEGVDASVRTGAAGDLLFLTNHTERSEKVSLPGTYTDLVTGRIVEKTIELEPYGTAVLK